MRRGRRRIANFVAVAGLAAAAAACVPVTAPPPPPPNPGPPPPPSAPLPAPPPEVGLPPNSPTLAKTELVTGLDRPWDIAFLPGSSGPDGAMLYTENDAKTVRVYSASAGADPVILTEADVDTGGEGGMMGIAVHPSWPSSPYVYVCFTSTSGNDNRVVRYTAAVTAGVPTALSTPQPIVVGMHKAGNHNGCRIRFQPGTTTLFVTMGDAARGPDPQDVNGLNGKVLRVTDTGASAGNSSGKAWYTRGHRNPQGITFDPLGGNTPWSAEHGPGINDEINKLVDGGNAGWDPNSGGVYDQSVPMTDLAKFPTAIRPQWRSGDSGTIAPSGLTFVQSGADDWKSWSGNIVFAMLKNMELRMLVVNGSRNVTGQVQVYSGSERLRVPVLGPDGKLYVTTDHGPSSGKVIVFDPS